MDNAERIAGYERRAANFYARVDNGRLGKGRDELYARPDDVPLTDEEIAAIDAFWGKYSFAYPHIDYKSFQTFKNRCGRFDVRHCPGNVMWWYFRRRSFNERYAVPYGNKTLAEYMFPDLPQPRTLFRRMDRYYYDGDYMPVESGVLVPTCVEFLKNGGEIVIKPGISLGSGGVRKLTRADADPAVIRAAITDRLPGRQSFVMQEAVRQSPLMASLNASSVNTLRITTLMNKGRPVALAALIRIGAEGKVASSFRNPGSALLGVDIDTGVCNDWALRRDMEHVSVLPSGRDLRERITVPNFDKIKAMVTHAHCRIPYLTVISWDLALDEHDQPVFIKCVPNGEVQLHEAVTGPLFGDYMEELLDRFLLKRFYVYFATETHLFREYWDRVEEEEYIGEGRRHEPPDELRGKPVIKKEYPKAPVRRKKGRLQRCRIVMRRVLPDRIYVTIVRAYTKLLGRNGHNG